MIVELEASLIAGSDHKGQAGLRMGLEATIRRPKPSDDFRAPLTPPKGQGDVTEPSEAGKGK